MDSPFHYLESDHDPVAIAAQHDTKTATSDVNSLNDRPVPPNTANIIALGKTGDGKSSLLNDMLGYDAFHRKRSVKSQTAQIEEVCGFWKPLEPHCPKKTTFGCNIKVVDTPGFGDSELRDQEFLPAIQQKMVDMASVDGIHCILMVFKVSTSEDNIMLCLCRLSDMLAPYGDFWSNVILVFTHADTSTVHLYRSHKVALKTKVGPGIKEHFNLDQELPMVFLSTQKHVCSYLKGSADCDCIIGNRYHADCRRRFFEQVWRRRNKPFLIDVQDEDIE